MAQTVTTTTESSIFESLPGVEVPVGKIAQSLEEIWANAPDGAGGAPFEFRTSQMNLVLHFGMRSTLESAKSQFEIALALSRLHPARILVLCPVQAGATESKMRAKLFSECFIGPSGKEMTCCEVVLLSYPFDTRRYMENQVAVVMDTDLPIYYCPHRIASVARLEDYTYLLKGARRIVLDSAVEPADMATALASIGSRIRDLAETRLLQVRQSLGRFMSGFEPATLVEGLARVIVTHSEARRAEGRKLLGWVRTALGACCDELSHDVFFDAVSGGHDLALDITYADKSRSLHWEADLSAGKARMSGNLGAGEVSAEGPVFLLKPEIALAEAIFS